MEVFVKFLLNVTAKYGLGLNRYMPRCVLARLGLTIQVPLSHFSS